MARIADLAMTMQEILGEDTETAIKVRWSSNFSHLYRPDQFAARIDEGQLARADQIDVRAIVRDGSAVVRFSALHGEPGSELVVNGPRCHDRFQALKSAVELGDWRPLSGQRLSLVGSATLMFVAGGVIGASELPASNTVVGALLLLLAAPAAGAALGLLYALVMRRLIRLLMPPLEIRTGSQASQVASEAMKWMLTALPAFAALTAAVGLLD